MSLRLPVSLFAAAMSLAGIASAQSLYEDFQYDAFGNVTQHRGPVYGPVPNPAELAAQTHNYTYTYSGGYSLLQQATHPGGQIENWTWDAQYRVTSHSRQGGALTESYTYDSMGRLASRTATNGTETYTWTFAYLAGNRTMTTDFRGGITLDTLDSMGRVIQSAGPAFTQTDVQAMITAGQYRQFTYDSNGDLVQIRNEAGAITFRSYNATHDKISETDPNGLVTYFDYDSQHRVIKVTRPGVSTALGSEFTSYDSAGRIEAQGIRTTSSNVTWIGNRYDASGNVVSRHGPAASLAGVQTMIANQTSVLEAAQFDALNRQATTFDGAMTPQESVAFGARNQETSHTYFGLGTATYDYDAADRLTRAVDSGGRTTVVARDALGRPVTETGPWIDSNSDGLANDSDPAVVLQRAYNLAGLETSHAASGSMPSTSQFLYTDLVSTTCGGVTTTYTRDAAGRCTEVRQNGVLVATFAYDVVGRLTVSKLAPGTSSEIRIDQTYDSGGRLVSVKKYPVAQSTSTVLTTTYSYDVNGRLSRMVHPTGYGCSYTYNLAGQPLTSTPDGAPAVTYAYDSLGRLTYKKNGGDLAWSYSYDALGNLATVVHGTQTFTLTHDANGRLTSQTEPGGVTYSFAYDASGKLTQSSSSIGGATRSYTYDAHDRLAAIQEGTTWYQYAYDASGRVTSFSNGFGEVFSYYYDSTGRLIARVVPNGDAFSYSYDSMSRISSIDLVRGSITEPMTSFTYDSIGRIVLRRIRGLVDERFAFDGCGRLNDYSAARSSTTLVHRVYKYNGEDRVSQIDHAAGDSETFTYTSFGALASSKRTGPNAYTSSLTYDAAGRIATSTQSGVTTTFGYDQASRLITAQKGSATTTYAYDAAGRVTSRSNGASTRTYTYDAWGRIATLTTGAVTTQFYRDPFGSILGAVTGSTIRYFTLDPNGEPVLSYNNWVLEEEDFGTGIDQKIWSERSGVDHVVLADPITGSVVRTLDESTLATAGFEYYPFGGSLGTSGATWNVDRFQGMRWDANHGIYWNGARMYDPEDCRFVEPDPIRASSLQKEYSRVGDDPVDFVDPSGLCTVGRVLGEIQRPKLAGVAFSEALGGLVFGVTELDSVDIYSEKYVYVNPVMDPPCYPAETDHARTSHSGDSDFSIKVQIAALNSSVMAPDKTLRVVGKGITESAYFHEMVHAVLLYSFVERFLQNALNSLAGIKSFMTHDSMAAYVDAKEKWELQRKRIINEIWNQYQFGSVTIMLWADVVHNGMLSQPTHDVPDTSDPKLTRVTVIGDGYSLTGPTAPGRDGKPIPATSIEHPTMQKAMNDIKEHADRLAGFLDMAESPCECRHTRTKQGH